ncbi:dynein heavy chain domain-containing protein 1 [Brachyistius frenatus]|uniref:dynein heavy chain domain-containing protein 1 n=1 Tax=Brachyistius frenatus TaxID=100188 RepID=UPI0037E709A2
MFAASSKERSHVGSSQTCGKDMTRPGSKVKKKAHPPEVSLPPLCPEPSRLSTPCAARPLFRDTSILKSERPDRPLTVLDLPGLVAHVQPLRAVGHTKWTEGPRLMASASGTDIPVRTTPSTAQSFTEKDESIKVPTCKDKKIMILKDGKAADPNTFPLSGAELVQILAQKRHLGDSEVYYLKEVDGDAYRPYDLRVVHPSEAGSEHYIFTPRIVLHVTEAGDGGLVSVAQWYREHVLWTALQKVPFFRDFRLLKTFARWHKNIHNICFQRKCKNLQDVLLMAVPQFRNALHVFTRVIEELKETHWMPLDSKTYTLLEFKNLLITKNQECLQILEKLSQYHTVILNTVKEGSYKIHQELQRHLKLARRPNRSNEPIHLLLAHRHKLKKELARSESNLQKLGRFAALVHQMIVQSLVTIIRQDAISFLHLLKRRTSQQCCLFHTELCFSGNSQLTVDPPTLLFQEAVSEALLTAGSSIVQMCDSHGFFLEISNSVFSSTQDLKSDSSDTERSIITGLKLKHFTVLILSNLSFYTSARWLLLPNETSQMVHGCYCPLSKAQLEWQISINDVTKHVVKEQANIMQEAELEIQQLCETYGWLEDVHLFISQWGQASLESMKGQPALLYDEHIKKVRHWAERINAADSSIFTSNQLFIIHFTHVKETQVQQLRLIEEDLFEQLVEQKKLLSESLTSDLERATDEHKKEPPDLHDFSIYALRVRESVKTLADTQKRLEYILSLRDTICINYRKMTEDELTLEEKMLALWTSFIPLLKQADSLVRHRLPFMADALDTMFSFLVCDFKSMISNATSGPFLDPCQNATEMLSKLKYMCLRVHSLHAKIEQLHRASQNMQENTMDLTILTTDVQKVVARKELWELITVHNTWLEEWKQLHLSEVVMSQAQENIAKWREQVESLKNTIPTHDAVLQETLGILESLSHQLVVMAKLQSPTLKEKHWRVIFQDMGLQYVPEKKVTVGDLMSRQLDLHQKVINKICRDAQTECYMEQTFLKLCQRWEDRLFHLDEFTLPVWQHCEPKNELTEKEKLNVPTFSQRCDDVLFTVTGLESVCAELENDLMTLSTMLESPYSVEFRLQLEDWIQSLKELVKLLDLFERYQQMWAFLSKVFCETSISDQRVDLLKRFQPVDETFKEIWHSISTHPHVLNFVSTTTNDRFHGNDLYQILFDDLSTMEVISNQMADLLDAIRKRCPRLWFLSDREVMQLLSFNPPPFTLQPFVCKCFKGVRGLEMDSEKPSKTEDGNSCEATSERRIQMKVLGVFGGLQEHFAFLSPLKPNLDALVWLCGFEKQLMSTMEQLIKQCAAVRKQLEPSCEDLACDKKVRKIRRNDADMMKHGQPALELLSQYPLQCLLVAEEAVWCSVVPQAFQESNPVKLSHMKAYNSAKLKNLGNCIRDGFTESKRESLVSKYTMMCLGALVQMTMKHGQQLSRLTNVSCELESSFEWLSLMKYHVNSEDLNLKGRDDPSCYVDVLGHRYEYGFEYSGPEDLMMAHTPSTDQARLGILLALKSYRCMFVSGPSMSGKKTAVVHLGKAMGRQVVVVQCYPNMTPGVVQRMLLGALQTGAWLLLTSVDFLTQGVLSLLGQHLADIHQSFSELRSNQNQRIHEEPEGKTADWVTGCTKVVDPEFHMVLGGKSISTSLSYGCVLISSKPYSSKIPESLRFATRSVALTHPDYRIIAEVMLTSIGFADAMPLSQRLVSLISLAKDSLCLPDLFTDDQCCYLILLQKIISSSQIHFEQTVKQRKITKEAKGPAAENTDLTNSKNLPVRLFEEDGKETEKLSKLRTSHLAVIQSLMEETAIVKAILSVVTPEHKRNSQFYSLFKDAFPISCQFPLFQQYTAEAEKNQLRDALTKELQQKQFYCDTEIIRSALTLYQTMKSSQACMLIGLSGSGKTTCYKSLAGAFNNLAAKAVHYGCENDNMIKRDTPQADPQISASNWSFVDTLVLFPNAMTHDEMFGCFCGKRGWQDGAVAKVLRDADRREGKCAEVCNNKKKSDETSIVTWLIMDGEPVGPPGWLDYITTLCNSQDPFLSLASGETLLSRPHLKVLMEITDLREASPSAVTRCSLVYFTGTDLWKAVWKSEMDVLSFEHKLDQGIVKLWNHLADDLFSSTLSFLGQEALTSAVHVERGTSRSTTYGLQEIMSFVRILRALLQHFGKEGEKSEGIPQIDKRGIPAHGANTPGTEAPSKPELLTRNLFLVAYIWGFGGHLHSRHWPQFDLLVHRVLFTCRYKIVVPDEESVFEHFFSIDITVFPKNTLLTNSIIAKNEKYRYLLTLMLEANQPVLLAGDPGSGKTTLCKILQCFYKPHIHLPASPLLSSRDLRTILNSISFQKNCGDAVGSMKTQPSLYLFVDDLHEAPCDVFGKASMALETLRQSISKGEVLTFDTFKSWRSGTITYMATCCVSGLGNRHNNVISSRLSRLFSVFVLPGLSVDIILSIHSPWLNMWLGGMPLKHSVAEMSNCIITATKNLYHAVCDKFQPTMQRPYFIFSHRDLQKVFRGMSLCQSDISNTGTIQKKENSESGFPPVPPGPLTSARNIIHLWMHECMRTFSDRLCSDDERQTLVSLIAKTAATHYGSKLVDETHPDILDGSLTATSLAVHAVPIDTTCTCQSTGETADTLNLPQEPKPAGQSELKKAHTLTEPSSVSGNICLEEEILKTHHLQPLILQHMEDIMARLVYGPDLTEARKSTNQQYDFKCSSYLEQDFDVLLHEMIALMGSKEEDEGQKVDNDCNIPTRYMVHRQGLSQLTHILRALLLPGGHGVLIGSDRGTGRKTTVRLAAHLAGCQLMELHSGNENKLHEILKEAGNQTRVGGVNVIILVHEDISQPAREQLLVAMAQRVYPALHTEDQLTNLVCEVTPVKYSRKYLRDNWMLEKFLSQVHKNVHVFLLMPLTIPDSSETPANNETQRWTAQMAKALRLSCCVELYKPWSNHSLVEVAAQCLKTITSKMTLQASEASLTVAMAGIHQSACQYASVRLRAHPFNPRTYMEFMSHFGCLCSHLHKQWQSKINRLASVLSHLHVLKNTALQLKQYLMKLQKKFAETQELEKELLRVVDDLKKLFQDACEECALEEKKLRYIEEQIDIAEKQMEPLFMACRNLLKCLNASDLEEVRHYRDPPDGVVKIMDAICLLFDQPPGWESAKHLLGQLNFFQELEFFDRYSLTDEQLQQLGEIVHSPLFVPEFVREISKACESLCRWVQAVYECCCLRHQLLVKQQWEMLAVQVRGRWDRAEERKKQAWRRLQDAMLQLQLVQKDLEEQLIELNKTEILEREAAAADRLVERHVRDWSAAAQEAELCDRNVAGDALILAATISYLGPFGPDVRSELLSKWRELCQTGSVDINPEDPRTSLFTHSGSAPLSASPGFPIPVTERPQLPLCQTLGMNERQLEDTRSATLMVKLLLWGSKGTCVQHWPLLADSQQHLEISSQNGLIAGENAKPEKETEFGMVVCVDDPELLNKLDQAAEKGLRVLVTHVERTVPTPQFLDKLSRPAGCCFPGLKQPLRPDHPDFCLYINTHLPVRLLRREIHASILAQVHVVDLSLSSEEIQELMLTQLLQSECRELLIQQARLQNYNQLLKEKLAAEEDALMDYILQSDTLLLQDPNFVPRVAACQDVMEEVQAEVKQLSEELEHHKSMLAVPRQLIRLTAALYQALQAVSRLSPAYYFSLSGFITVMQAAFTVKGRPLITCESGKEPGSTIAEIMNTMVVRLLVQYRPCLFKSHAAVLKLLVSLALLQHNQLCSEAERSAFLRGLEDIEPSATKVKKPASPPTVSPPSWVSPHIHSELVCLERIACFRGLIDSLSTSPVQWQEYLHFPSSTVAGPVPCRSHSHLSFLQRALLWKTMLPNCLEELADLIYACHLCPSETGATEIPHAGNPEALSRYLVKHEGPIILTLPNLRGDERTSIQPLYLINQLARCVAETKEVQVKVISFGTQCDSKLILSMLNKAVNDGHWLVFNNCHLLEQWDDKVVAHLSQVISSSKAATDEQLRIHPCFRLWFITQENASHSIAAAVRMCALPLVCDSAHDLKEELSWSLGQEVSVTQSPSRSGVGMELLLRCAIFHSVLLQRQNYTCAGQGRVYHWSQEDLLALVDAHICTASLCHDQVKVLQYIAVNLVHGGHVMDSADLEVVESVAKTCFSKVSPLSGSGPHLISNIIRKAGHYDLSGLLRVLDPGLWDSAVISDPVMLGFSVDMAAEIIKIKSHNLNRLLQASQTPVGTLWSFSSKPNQLAVLPSYSQARDQLRALESYLSRKKDGTVSNAGGVSHHPLRDFFQAEWDDLVDLVSLLLSLLQQPVQYMLTFASFHELADLSRLERRAELLGVYLWHHSASDPPSAYRLSAFKNATGFLVAVMRDAAQINHKYISDIMLHFQVLCDHTYPASLPLGTVYLCGLELKGASWDTQLAALQDTHSSQQCSLPLLCVKAKVRSTDTALDASCCKSSYLTDTSNVQVAGVSPSTGPQLPVYHCPLYLDEEQRSGSRALADVNIITKVPLHAKLNPVLCSLRRVRLVSTL